MPVRWLLPSVGVESKTICTPSHSTPSSRSDNGSQSRCREYQPIASVALDAVRWTW